MVFRYAPFTGADADQILAMIEWYGYDSNNLGGQTTKFDGCSDSSLQRRCCVVLVGFRPRDECQISPPILSLSKPIITN